MPDEKPQDDPRATKGAGGSQNVPEKPSGASAPVAKDNDKQNISFDATETSEKGPDAPNAPDAPFAEKGEPNPCPVCSNVLIDDECGHCGYRTPKEDVEE